MYTQGHTSVCPQGDHGPAKRGEETQLTITRYGKCFHNCITSLFSSIFCARFRTISRTCHNCERIINILVCFQRRKESQYFSKRACSMHDRCRRLARLDATRADERQKDKVITVYSCRPCCLGERDRGGVTETGRGRWGAKTVTWQLSVGNAMHDSLTALLPASSPAPRRILGQGSTLQLRDRARQTCAWSELVQHIFARWPHHANINTMRECIYLKDNSVLVESGFNDLRCRERTQPQGLQRGYFVVYILFHLRIKMEMERAGFQTEHRF